MELAEVIDILKARRSVVTRESAAFSRLVLQLLAEGEPVTPERLAEASEQPIEMIRSTFAAMENGGCEFDDQGALIGNALTVTPTPHHFRVNGHELYAWCALDTLCLPALIGQTAEIASSCPHTGTSIHLTVAPDGIEAFIPAETMLSIVIASGCTSGIDGTFCGQIHFFASSDAAEMWRADRADITLLPLAEAYQLAHTIYEPVLSALRN